MRLFFFTIVFMIVAANMVAVPADGVQRNFVQPDGTQITVRQLGDEYFHFMVTLDGFLVTEGEQGGLYYSIFSDDMMLSSGILAHNIDQRNTPEKAYLEERLKVKYDECAIEKIRNIHIALRDNANARRSKVQQRLLGTPSSYLGEKKGLVILVEFPNQRMSSETPHDDYDRMFNAAGYSENGHVGSVHDYFFDQSYGQFDLTFDVVGPVMMSQNYGYYGSDALNGQNDMNVREMIIEACLLADEYVDFRDYDWDSDGEVDQVFIVYAGYGQATGGASNTVWPHESYVMNGPVLDGVQISQYACSNELYGSGGTEKTLMGIGTACHEFSHCLGLPDLYDTDYSGAFGMSYWGVMNSGSYNGPRRLGEVPCGYTAFERWFSGWLDFIDIEESQKVENLPSLEEDPVAYRIINEGNANEFYTFENRQPDKWFKYVASYEDLHGLLVTHIDYDLKAWSSNQVNPTAKHQRMSPIVADNNYSQSYNGFAGDLFPGTNNVTELTNTSHVDFGGRLFNKNVDDTYNMNKSILDIRESDDGQISFDIIFNYEIPTPVATAATDITEHSFVANWMSDNAESYTIELEMVKKIKPYVSETVLIENIYQTEYQVKDIDAVFCNYRVRANKGDLHTEWSNVVDVTLGVPDRPDGIEGIQDQSGANSDIYGLNGIRVSNPHKGNIVIKNKKKFIIK